MIKRERPVGDPFADALGWPTPRLETAEEILDDLRAALRERRARVARVKAELAIVRQDSDAKAAARRAK